MDSMSTATPNTAASSTGAVGDTLSIASSPDDARAVETLEERHAELTGALEAKGESLLAAARAGNSDAFHSTREDLVLWARHPLLPHLQALTETLDQAAADQVETRLLVRAMRVERSAIGSLVDEVHHAHDVVAALGAAAALRRVLALHLAKENEQILPVLVADPQVNVADLLTRIQEIVDTEEQPEQNADTEGHTGHGGHSCSCGETDGEGYPELDVQTIPHAIRHATLFGAIDALRPAAGLILRATHDPVPLLNQLAQRAPGVHQVDYLERGPEFWRLQVVRRG